MARTLIVVIMITGLLLGAFVGVGLRAMDRRASCAVAGGHYVVQSLGADECWAPDGTHRLFPEGF